LNGEVELACVPRALPEADRQGHFALARKLFSESRQTRKELKDGYAWRFSAEDFERIARFVANDRKCCPFVTFELTIEPGAGPVRLRMTGPEGTRAVLLDGLDSSTACRCGQERE
jgi:hypothetical protein